MRSLGAASKRKRGPSASAEEAGEESKRGSVDKSRGLFTGSPIEPGYGEAGLGTGRFGD